MVWLLAGCRRSSKAPRRRCRARATPRPWREQVSGGRRGRPRCGVVTASCRSRQPGRSRLCRGGAGRRGRTRARRPFRRWRTHSCSLVALGAVARRRHPRGQSRPTRSPPRRRPWRRLQAASVAGQRRRAIRAAGRRPGRAGPVASTHRPGSRPATPVSVGPDGRLSQQPPVGVVRLLELLDFASLAQVVPYFRISPQDRSKPTSSRKSPARPADADHLGRPVLGGSGTAVSAIRRETKPRSSACRGALRVQRNPGRRRGPVEQVAGCRTSVTWMHDEHPSRQVRDGRRGPRSVSAGAPAEVGRREHAGVSARPRHTAHRSRVSKADRRCSAAWKAGQIHACQRDRTSTARCAPVPVTSPTGGA